MATVTEEPKALETGQWIGGAAQSFLLYNVPWDDYEAMLSVVGDRRIRVTYDRGTLELMSPSVQHEGFGYLLGRIVQVVCEELEIPYLALRPTTWRRRLREGGLEADECFYLANTGRILAKGKEIDLYEDPAPDLCIEIEVSKSALDRMGIYAALGVPEVWRFNGREMRVAELQPDGVYASRERSTSLPFLPLAEVVRLVQAADGMDHMNWGKLVRAWVREVLVPRYQPPAGRAD
jgi:Uma2 family endonuclease